MAVSKRSKSPRQAPQAAVPASLADLKEDPRNPRTITQEAAKGLDRSIEEFGDLSGITFNSRTGQLVGGHQRVQRLREKFGDLKIVNGEIVTPGGDRFALRIVDWPLTKQRAANIAANAPTIQGQFTNELELLLAETQQADANLYDAFLLDHLRPAPVTTSTPRAKQLCYKIVVELANEADQKALFEHLKSRNYQCSLKTS